MGTRKYNGEEYLSYYDNRICLYADAGTKDRMEKLMVYYNAEITKRFSGRGVARLVRWLVAKQYEVMKAECLRKSKDLNTEIVARSKRCRNWLGDLSAESHVGTYIKQKEGKNGVLGTIRKESEKLLRNHDQGGRGQEGNEPGGLA